MPATKRPYPVTELETSGAHTILLHGRRLHWREINEIAEQGCHLDLADEAWERVRLARAALLDSDQATYGMTTGLGVHAYGKSGAGNPGEDFGISILIAHATELDATPAPMHIARAAVIMWCNQAAATVGGVPGVSVELVQVMISWLNNRETSTPPMLDLLAKTDTGFGAIVVNSQLALHILRESNGQFAYVRAGEALPLMSHSNLLLAKAARQCASLEQLLAIGAAVSALSLAGFEGNSAIFEDERRWRSASEHEATAASAIAAWTAGKPHWTPRRLQDPLDLRCLAGTFGVLRAAFVGADGLASTLERLSSTAQCNPVVLPDEHGGFERGSATSTLFDTACLRAALDNVRGGLGEVCGRTHSRIVTLSAPLLNGSLPVGLSTKPNGGVHNFNLPVIAAALAHRASAASAHRPVGVPVQAADGVECVAAYTASASAAVDDLIESATSLLAIEALTALAALRCRAATEEPTLTPQALGELIRQLDPLAQRLDTPTAPFSIRSFERALEKAVADAFSYTLSHRTA